LQFSSGVDAPLYVKNAEIRDLSSGATGTVLFDGGSSSAYIPARTSLWSDWVALRQKNMLPKHSENATSLRHN
jgi:hypothetical protein